MSLGNVPRRNMSAEDRDIQLRLTLHDALTKRYELLHMTRADASKKAFSEVTGLNRKQLQDTIQSIIDAAKGNPF
jgi:hypothetical protein